MRIWRDGVELDAGPRQQAYLLALLLVRAGRPISMSELIDLIWGDDVPASALNILQKYIGTLRRLLEPALPARETGSYLQRRGSGYLFASSPGMLDVVSFRELVDEAGTRLAEQRLDAAFDRYARALELWHGPAGDGLPHGSTAVSLFAALNEEFFGACVTAAELAVMRGQAERVLAPLRLAAAMAPLNEAVQASLLASLAAVGRQAEALAVFGTVRARLAEELGVDPGPVLRAAHLRILSQPPPSSASAGAAEGGPDGTARRSPPFPRPTEPAAPAGRAEETPPGRPRAPAVETPLADRLIGRAEELKVLRHAVASAFAGGAALVLVEGEPGAGKTRLLEEAGADAGRLGALVVWGHCLDGGGMPSMWPWVRAVAVILDSLPAAARQEWRAGELGRLVEPRDLVAASALPDAGAQFRLFERAVALVGQACVRRPVVLVVDDLQWADVASLRMFSHLAARMPGGTVIIGALRDRAPAPASELARMLAAASRLSRHRRIRLGPLDPAEVAELVHRETGQPPGPAVARGIHARTAGNPFFVRELARFLAEGGALTEQAAARAGVPVTVRDVVRDRMAGLDDDTRGLAQIAALIGRDVDLGLLAGVAGLDARTCVDLLEPLEALGLLEPQPGDPFSFRFAHDLVRESVVETTPPPRATRLHLRVADALERSVVDGEAVAERLAHHLWAAGPLADPARTAAALVRAGRRAAAKSAFEAASRQLESAARVARTAGLAELELSAVSLLTAVVGMRSGYVGSATDLLERAEHLARGLGREREAADFLFSRWVAYSQGIQLDRSGPLACRLLEQGEASADPVIRAYGRHAWGFHQWGVGNIGEAFRYLSQSHSAMRLAERDEEPLRHDLQLLSPVMLALNTALHGDVDGARALLDRLEAAAGDDPYAVTVWSAFAVTVAALAGDPAWALRAAERGIAVDPEFSYGFLGSYPRLARWWARAMTGEDPAGAAAAAQELIDASLLDPPRSCLASWYGLLAEMRLAAGMPVEAGAALDRAEELLGTYGERYAEGHVLLLRARLLLARGEPTAAVRAAAERARALSVEREAHLFADRAAELLAGLAQTPPHR
ncbi:BTAD domain-containing putative transcriptional regulator [Frankia nepalensis]|uniref:BTAD domain-containing putative transcriptional regulator n=1 Tax=Frankia nepalensis TaxID=1836974 RepID=UPI0019337667|nr:BTAD domain-containing putative transcriptional regulator [Frankia nepalensis]MBL7512833.1 AAA family ATPase [Frankia nepalensis]